MVVEKKKRYRSREQSRKQSKNERNKSSRREGERGGVSINRVAINSSVCMLSSINIPHRINHTHPHLITMRSRHHIPSHLQSHITEPHVGIPTIRRLIGSHTTATATVHQLISRLSSNIAFVGVIPKSGFVLGAVEEAGEEDREGEGNVDDDEEEVADSKDCVVDTEAAAPCQFISET